MKIYGKMFLKRVVEQEVYANGYTGLLDASELGHTDRRTNINGIHHSEWFYAFLIGNSGAGYNGLFVLGKEMPRYMRLKEFKEGY